MSTSTERKIHFWGKELDAQKVAVIGLGVSLLGSFVFRNPYVALGGIGTILGAITFSKEPSK
jgi:hypothetical protein